ncbi:MAG TPA: hypothetical protein VH684_31400 [Xanthobacteraceae bacterium]
MSNRAATRVIVTAKPTRDSFDERSSAIRSIWYVSSDRQAVAVVESVRDSLADQAPPGQPGWYAAEPAAVSRAIEAAAAGLGIELTTAAELRAWAEVAVRQACEAFDQLRSTGKLRHMNRTYRQQRLAAEAAGKRAQPYSAWLYQQRLRMVATVAGAVQSAGGQFGELPGAMARDMVSSL